MNIKKLISGITAVMALNMGMTAVSADTAVGVQLGDVNGDGKVNVRDCAVIARKLAERKAEEMALSVADFNGDGNVNIRDAASLAQALAQGYVKTEIKADTSPFAFDWSGYITSKFGYYEMPDGTTEFHNGIDFAVPHGTEELSVATGKIVKVCNSCTHDEPKEEGCGCGGNKGNYVSILTNSGYYITYSHMADVYVSVGDKIRNGQSIGTAGATGMAREYGLHLEILSGGEYGTLIDPLRYIKQYSPLA